MPTCVQRASARGAAWLLPALLLPLAGACDCGGGGDPLDTFAPDLRVAPTEVDFGAWPLGATGLREITLINDGNAPVQLAGQPSLQGPEAAGFALEPFEGVFPLEGGAIRELVVSFSPSAERAFEGVLVLPCAAPLGRVEIPLRAEGVPADVQLVPQEVDFGDVAVGASSSAILSVESRSDAPLTVPLVVEGTGFLMDGATRRTLTLEPNGREEVTVTFLPGRGGPFEARLVAELCGEGCGPSASLVGAGLAPRIQVTPRPLDLGEVALGEEQRGTLTITNVGVGTLSVSSLQILDDQQRISLVSPPALPLSLEAGAEASVEVRYLASEPDAEVTASLVVGSNDPLSPRVNVPLFAVTPGAALRVVPSAAHFGLLDAGDARDLDVLALASGTAPVTLESVSLSGPGAAWFELVTPLPSSALVLEPGDSVLLTVRALPDEAAVSAGGAAASLVFTTLEAPVVESALTFVSGSEGCQPRAQVSSLNLGAVRVGLGASGTLVVENVGTATCTYHSLGGAQGLPFDAGFTWTTEGITPLAPGARAFITVGYVATSQGTSSAYFALRFVEQPAPLFLSATASGVLGALVAEPPTVHFGPNAEGCPARSGIVAYVNDGAGPITVNEIVLEPEDAAFDLNILGNGAGSVPAGGTLEVSVTPHTTAMGVYTGRLLAITEEVGEVVANMTSEVSPPDAPISETFQVVETAAKIDVLFIVDNSGSMADDQAILADNFEAFIAAADGEGSVDFHIGVTTTDVISPGAAAGKLLGTPKVLSASTPALASQFAERALVGVDGHGLELGLEAMRLALSEPTLSNANGGFYRADAALSVVVVTDEDDSGDFPDLTAFYPEGARSVDGYISFLAALKGGSLSNAPVLFSAVSLFAPRYQALVEAFGGVQLDLASDWGTELGQIGDATFGLGRTFRLASTPTSGSVTVSIDGVPTTAFDVKDGRLIVLDEAPPPGAEVTVTYVAECS